MKQETYPEVFARAQAAPRLRSGGPQVVVGGIGVGLVAMGAAHR